MPHVQERVQARLDRPSMTGGEAPIKARGRPPICCANRFPPRPLRGAALRAAALTAAPPPVPRTPFSMVRTKCKEVIMGMVQGIGTASDSVVATLVAGLEIELGRVREKHWRSASWTRRRAISTGMGAARSVGWVPMRALARMIWSSTGSRSGVGWMAAGSWPSSSWMARECRMERLRSAFATVATLLERLWLVRAKDALAGGERRRLSPFFEPRGCRERG